MVVSVWSAMAAHGFCVRPTVISRLLMNFEPEPLVRTLLVGAYFAYFQQT